MTPWLQYLIAFVVGCHGLTYIPFGLCVPDNLTEWRRSSWLLGSSITGDRLKALVLTVHVMAGFTPPVACRTKPLMELSDGLGAPGSPGNGIISPRIVCLFPGNT